MRVLLTNDDGISAVGLRTLRDVVKSIDGVSDVWIVAPSLDKSCTSHAISLLKKLTLRKIQEQVYEVEGTPVDCVIIALNALLVDMKIDLIISGINHGVNVSQSIIYSGTVAAAMQGTIRSIPSIAISQFYDKQYHDVSWSKVRSTAKSVLEQVIVKYLLNDILININLPDSECKFNGLKFMQNSSQHFFLPTVTKDKDAYIIDMIKSNVATEFSYSIKDLGLAVINPITIPDFAAHKYINEIRDKSVFKTESCDKIS